MCGLDGIGPRCLLGLHRIFERRGINAEENLALFHGDASLRRHFGYYSANRGNDGRGVVVERCLATEWVIIIHPKNQRGQNREATERGGEQAVAVNRDL